MSATDGWPEPYGPAVECVQELFEGDITVSDLVWFDMLSSELFDLECLDVKLQGRWEFEKTARAAVLAENWPPGMRGSANDLVREMVDELKRGGGKTPKQIIADHLHWARVVRSFEGIPF